VQWKVIVKDFMEDQAVILFEGEEDQVFIPKKYLPRGCREGDILSITISFNPFETLKHLYDDSHK
jgi:hypothetical protein